MSEKKWYLGKSKTWGMVWLTDFSWDCGWYWGGGYLGNKNCHFHVSSYFTDYKADAYTAIKSDFESLKLTDDQLWRFCDLFKQFYAYQEAAECFKFGGHYTSKDRNPKEINDTLYIELNKHLEEVIIPEIRKLMDSIH